MFLRSSLHIFPGTRFQMRSVPLHVQSKGRSEEAPADAQGARGANYV